jgi:hypothetical protein
MLVLIAIHGREAPHRALLAAFMLLAILVSPLTELWFHGWGLAGALKALLLFILFVLALKYPLSETVQG